MSLTAVYKLGDEQRRMAAQVKKPPEKSVSQNVANAAPGVMPAQMAVAVAPVPPIYRVNTQLKIASSLDYKAASLADLEQALGTLSMNVDDVAEVRARGAKKASAKVSRKDREIRPTEL
jgi:hypothetical protein